MDISHAADIGQEDQSFPPDGSRIGRRCESFTYADSDWTTTDPTPERKDVTSTVKEDECIIQIWKEDDIVFEENDTRPARTISPEARSGYVDKELTTANDPAEEDNDIDDGVHQRLLRPRAGIGHFSSLAYGLGSLRRCRRIPWGSLKFYLPIVLSICHATNANLSWAALTLAFVLIPEMVLFVYSSSTPIGAKHVIRMHLGTLAQLTLLIYTLAKQLPVTESVSYTIYFQISAATYLVLLVLHDVVSVPERWQLLHFHPDEVELLRRLEWEFEIRNLVLDAILTTLERPSRVLHFFGTCTVLSVRIAIIVLFSIEFGGYIFVLLLLHILIGALAVNTNYLKRRRCDALVDTDRLRQMNQFRVCVMLWIIYPCCTFFCHFCEPLIRIQLVHHTEFLFYYTILTVEKSIVLGLWAVNVHWNCSIISSVSLSCIGAFATGILLLYIHWEKCYEYAKQRTQNATVRRKHWGYSQGIDGQYPEDELSTAYHELLDGDGYLGERLDNILTIESRVLRVFKRRCRRIRTYLPISKPKTTDTSTRCSSCLWDTWERCEVGRNILVALTGILLYAGDIISDWYLFFVFSVNGDVSLAVITLITLLVAWPILTFQTLAAHKDFVDENGNLKYGVPEGGRPNKGHQGYLYPKTSWKEYLQSLPTKVKIMYVFQFGPVLRYYYFIRHRGTQCERDLTGASLDDKNRYAALRTNKSLTTQIRLMECYLETLPQMTLQIFLLLQGFMDKGYAVSSDIRQWAEAAKIVLGVLVILYGIVTSPNGYITVGKHDDNVLCYDSYGSTSLKIVRYGARLLTLTVRIAIITLFLTCLAPWIIAVFGFHSIIVVMGLITGVLDKHRYTKEIRTTYPLGRSSYPWEDTFARWSVWIIYPCATFFDHFANLKLFASGKEFVFYYTIMLLENSAMLASWAVCTELACPTVLIIVFVLTGAYLCGVIVLGKRSTS